MGAEKVIRTPCQEPAGTEIRYPFRSASVLQCDQVRPEQVLIIDR
jgi:hypothetical protein